MAIKTFKKQVTISEFKGLNSSTASLQLKPGEFQSSQNLRGRPYFNYARRKGIEPVSVQDSAVLGIFDIDLDNITIPLIQNEDSLVFFPPTASASLPTADPYPLSDPLDAAGERLFIFPIEQVMRAIQNRRIISGMSAYSWPNVTFTTSGIPTNVAVSTYPANGTYGPDLAYHDLYNGNPIGTRAAALVNQVIACCINTVDNPEKWISSIAGETTIQYYTNSIFPAAASATVATYASRLSDCKAGIRLMSTIKEAATQIDKETKTGDAQDAGGCSIMFPGGVTATTVSTAGCNPCSCAGDALICGGCEVWDGTLPYTSTSGNNCVYQATGDGVCLSMGGQTLLLVDLRSTDGAGLEWAIGYSLHVDNGLACLNLEESDAIWIGTFTSAIAGDPRGVYTKTFGCSGTATVTVS